MLFRSDAVAMFVGHDSSAPGVQLLQHHRHAFRAQLHGILPELFPQLAQLSVIEIKPYRERQKRTLYPPKESNRDRLCGVIDTILAEKPKDYEVFLQGLEQQGYEVKRGKYTSVKGARQKRFIRFRTLGAGYSEEELKAVISGETEHHPRQKQKRIVPEQKFQMLVDIQAKLEIGRAHV